MRKLFVESLNRLFRNKENYPNLKFEKIESKTCRTWRIKSDKYYLEFHAYSENPEHLIVGCENKYHKFYSSDIDCRFYHNKECINRMILDLVQTLN